MFRFFEVWLRDSVGVVVVFFVEGIGFFILVMDCVLDGVLDGVVVEGVGMMKLKKGCLLVDGFWVIVGVDDVVFGDFLSGGGMLLFEIGEGVGSFFLL